MTKIRNSMYLWTAVYLVEKVVDINIWFETKKMCLWIGI